MDNPTPQPQPATQPTAGAPEVSRPFSLPADYTTEMAKARLDEVKTDGDWQKRFFAGDKRTIAEFDALTRHALGQQQPEAKQPQSPTEAALAALGPPETPEGYRRALVNTRDPVTGRVVSLDSENQTLVDKTLFPAAHALGLALDDITMAADFVVRPMSAERCEQTLRNIWRGDYEQGVQDFVAAMGAVPEPIRELLTDQFEEQLGNNPALIASIVAAYRRRQARGR